jgi:hypothetical protein
MEGPDAENNITIQLGPFNNAGQVVNQIDFVIHYNNNTWNNNNGADFHIPVNNSPTGITDAELQRKVSLWPVPADHHIVVGVDVAMTGNHRLSIQALSGQILMEQAVEKENFRIDVSNLPNGMYLLMISNSGGSTVARRKMVVQH